MTPKQEGHNSILEIKGKEAIFVGYTNDHTGGEYIFYDIASKTPTGMCNGAESSTQMGIASTFLIIVKTQ